MPPAASLFHSEEKIISTISNSRLQQILLQVFAYFQNLSAIFNFLKKWKSLRFC